MIETIVAALAPSATQKPRGRLLAWMLALAGVASLALLKLRNNATLAPR